MDIFKNTVNTVETTVFDKLTGQVASTTTPEGTVYHSYNPATGQLVETWTGNANRSLSTTDTAYSYDALGRLSTVTSKALNGVFNITPLVTSYNYDAAGNLASMTLPDNIKTNYFYDDLNRLLIEKTTQPDVNPNTHQAFTRILAEYDYGLNTDGTRSYVQEHIAILTDYTNLVFTNSTISYVYDNLNRLKEEIRNSDITGTKYDNYYYYDLAGNRTELVISGGATTTYAYNALDQQTVQKSGGTETDSTYDNNGSLVTQTTTGSPTATYTWDLRNRMSSATINGITTNYTYDSSSFRISETTNGQTRTYLADYNNLTGNVQAIEEKVNGTFDRSYILGNTVIAQYDSQGMAYLLRDGHGSTRMLANSNSVITDPNTNEPLLYSYDAFGTAIGFNAATARTTQQFGGDGEYDGITGLTYHDARWRQGYRFISMDSYEGQSSDPMSLHKYVFANSDALNGWDPSGHLWIAPSIARMLSGLGVYVAMIALIGIRATYVLGDAYMDEVNRDGVLINRQIARQDDSDISPVLRPELFDAEGDLKPEYRQRPDIADNKLQSVYEIKHVTDFLRGPRQVDSYINALNVRFPASSYKPGNWNPKQTEYEITSLPGIIGLPEIQITANNVGHGIIEWTSNYDTGVLAASIAFELVKMGIKLTNTVDEARGENQIGVATLLAVLGFA